jgi:hypothetical protein
MMSEKIVRTNAQTPQEAASSDIKMERFLVKLYEIVQEHETTKNCNHCAHNIAKAFQFSEMEATVAK